MKAAAAIQTRDRERGQVIMVFALILPMVLALSGVVVGIGNWYVHGKNLQSKADAGAFGGGSAWSFPCVNADPAIIDQARVYAGPTTANPTGVNPQVGGVPAANIHTVLNANDWYDDDNTPQTPPEFVSPAGSVCEARILDVKVTEDNSFPLASLIPLFPDIKRKARVRIEQSEAQSGGLLPIAVRVPKPLARPRSTSTRRRGRTTGGSSPRCTSTTSASRLHRLPVSPDVLRPCPRLSITGRRTTDSAATEPTSRACRHRLAWS